MKTFGYFKYHDLVTSFIESLNVKKLEDNKTEPVLFNEMTRWKRNLSRFSNMLYLFFVLKSWINNTESFICDIPQGHNYRYQQVCKEVKYCILRCQ